jgi:hypothetical protein
MAYIDSNTGKPELFRIGEDDKPYIPSLFYISNDGDILCGDDAMFLGKDDPSGLLDQPLKRSLRESIIIAGNGHKTTPKILLQTLFVKLCEKLRHHPDFSNDIENKIVLTIPAQYGPSDELLIRDAAVDAGFKDEHITFVYEPIAAAQAWLNVTNRQSEFLIVLDCGGGTLDWACLKQPKPGIFELVHDLPPGGDNRIGGYDIDEELYKHMLCNLPQDEMAFSRKNRNLILLQIQALKEKYSKTEKEGILSLSKTKYKIPVSDIEEIIMNRYVHQAISSITPYIERATSRYGNSKPYLLLVGGSSRFKLLYDELMKSEKCTPVIWERSEYATVLGAVSGFCNSQKEADLIDDDNIQKNSESVISDFPNIVDHPIIMKPKSQIADISTEVSIRQNSSIAIYNNQSDDYMNNAVNYTREVKMDEFKTNAQACYAIIQGKASSNQWVQGISGAFGFPFTLAADVGVVPGIYAPLWSEIRAVFGMSPVTLDAAGPVIKNIIPEVVSDLLLDKVLGQLPLIGIYFNVICAKHMTWRLGTLFSMMSARGESIVSDNVSSCMKLIRMLFPQQAQFTFTTPERNAFIRLVTSVSDVSPADYREKIKKALLAME